MSLPTLTEAQNRNHLTIIRMGRNITQSSARRIPYAERYRASTGIAETPAQHIQKAARDEAKRKISH